VSTKKWRLCLTPLNSTTPLRELEVDAANWMGALRAGRVELGEDGTVPAGASCAVAPDGTVTVLDAAARRKFLLTPLTHSAPAPAPEVAPATVAAAPQPTAPAPAANSGKRKFQTVAYTPGMPLPGAEAPAAAEPAPTKKKKFETVAFSPDQAKAMMQGKDPIAVGTPVPAQVQPPAKRELELLLQREDQPTKENPLTYRERAYVIPDGMRVSDAEAALRAVLAEFQVQLQSAARGKLVTLAAFDHRWTDTPERPPLVTLQWRDWRGDPVVDYPAAIRAPSLPPVDPTEIDDRMATVFEALTDLAHKRTAIEGLELAFGALQQVVPCAAASGCLYDINTDQLRFVVLTGPGARERQGHAIARNLGLMGQAARIEQSIVVPDLRAQPMYSPATDGRPGLDAANMLLRSAMHDGQLLGVLQLIDRQGMPFTAGDVHVVNYVADRLGEFLLAMRARPVH
jgi:GAF domain